MKYDIPLFPSYYWSVVDLQLVLLSFTLLCLTAVFQFDAGGSFALLPHKSVLRARAWGRAGSWLRLRLERVLGGLEDQLRL